MNGVVPLQTGFVYASVRLIFKDEYFVRHDGFFTDTFKRGEWKFSRRQHMFFSDVTHSGETTRKFCAFL